jgi:1-piperideine-2-carboxylate/1-pyrroline-2-carboxylate reductase [NAD(P)H]
VSVTYLDKASLSLDADYPALVTALEQALRTDVDPETDSPRLFSPAPGGEFLIMPSTGHRYSGTKLVTIAPGNPAQGRPKIQGTYVLFNSETLAPVAVMDGAELTLLRTPATTALAVKNILAADPRGRASNQDRPEIPVLLVFGTGPQASRHIQAISAITAIGEVVIVGRTADRATSLADEWTHRGLKTRVGNETDVFLADVIVCVTSSHEPLFDGDLVRPNAIVAAVGSHGIDAREIDPSLALRADIVVEGRASAMREAGNLIPARSREEWEKEQLTNLAELARGAFTRRLGAPALYTGVGMAWEDLVVAAHIHEQHINGKASS